MQRKSENDSITRRISIVNVGQVMIRIFKKPILTIPFHRTKGEEEEIFWAPPPKFLKISSPDLTDLSFSGLDFCCRTNGNNYESIPNTVRENSTAERYNHSKAD
jgi:ATP-dependent protease Clp ATPase subunit